MCVIIYAPKGKKISKNELKEAYDYNDDGCGMAWIEGGKVHYSKGYTNFEVFYNCMETKITNTTIDRVFHFRITSRGTTNCYQTHPFLASDDKKDMELLDYTGTTPVLFMNGTITKQKLYNGLNDTASYIIDNLSDNKINLSSKSTIKKIDKETGSKWAIVETSGVTLVGTFEEEDGLYFSNTYHRWSYWTNYSYNKSTKSYTKTVKDYYNDMYKLFPDVPKEDVRRALNYGWKCLYLYNSRGADTIIKDKSFWCYIGYLKKNSLDYFSYYIKKLALKLRILY